MANLVQVESIALLNSAALGAAYTPATLPIKMRLLNGTTTPTSTTAGTEITGGGYSAGGLAVAGPSVGSVGFGTSTAQATGSGGLGSLTNANAVNFTNMPALAAGTTAVTNIELWDSAGTPVRRWFGALTAAKATNSGDTLSFAASSITLTIG